MAVKNVFRKGNHSGLLYNFLEEEIKNITALINIE